MKRIEANIRTSFKAIKLDMISIKGQILQIAEAQKELREMVLDLERESALNSRNKKTVKNTSGKKKIRKKR